MTDLTRSNSLALRKCECCGRHPYTVGISNPHSEWQDWADYSEARAGLAASLTRRADKRASGPATVRQNWVTGRGSVLETSNGSCGGSDSRSRALDGRLR
jgi:hypothetical protein